MDVNTSDPYEQKLYNMFKSFDIQSIGSLDKDSLIELCRTLELKDRGHKLVATLIDTKRKNRCTFAEFKEGLLNLLGTDAEDDDVYDSGASGKISSTEHRTMASTTTSPKKSVFDESTDDISAVDTTQTSAYDNESRSREVSPKLVVRGKKYGRRSRPQSAAQFESSQSDSEEDYDCAKRSAHDATSKSYQKVQRSVSQSDMHDTNGRHTRQTNTNTITAEVSIYSGTKLKRCASLPAQKHPHNAYAKETPNLKTQRESSVESLGNLDFENLSNSLFHEWNNYAGPHEVAITDDCKAAIQPSQQPPPPPTSSSSSLLNARQPLATMQRNRSELEMIFTRVGLQTTVASKLADEVYEKLGLPPDRSISLTDFLSLIHCNSDSDTRQILPWSTQSSATTKHHTDTEYSLNPLNDHMITELHAASDELDTLIPETLSADRIVDLWEMSNIKNAGTLLEDLGFNDKEINLSQLLNVIDEELQNCHDDKELSPLLRASLALHKTEMSSLQKSLRHATHENKQLHINVNELNRRTIMLAHEIDERHATIESSAREELRQLEQRHAEIVRDLTAQLSNEREQWSILNGKLEKRIKQFESDDAKLKSDMQCVQSENSALEIEQLSLQTQIADLLEKNIQLNNEIADAQDRQFGIERDGRADEQALELIDKIAKLQIENANLRDKNDELATELEEMHIEMNKARTRGKQIRFDGNNQSGGEDNASEGSNMSYGSATKRRGDSPSKAKLSEESPRFGKLRKCHNDNSEGESETSGDWLALNSELNQSVSISQTTATTSGFSQDFSSLNDQKDNEIKELRAQIAKLDGELAVLKRQRPTDSGSVDVETSNDATDSNATTPTNAGDVSVAKTGGTRDHAQRIQELENSLEQMQKEYEACEDYWQSKLNEERQLYEDEQRISDEKFTELLKKMAEYEEQFSSSNDKDGRLTPIEEKYQLEQQYADLETEVEDFREHARKIFEEKTKEIEQLHGQIRELESRVLPAELTNVMQALKTSDAESVASSPISYLWNQSTIQSPNPRDYQNPNWNRPSIVTGGGQSVTTCGQSAIGPPPQTPSTSAQTTLKNTAVDNGNIVIDNTTEILDDLSSVRSFDTHSIASTHSVHRSLPEIIGASPSLIREDIKRMKFIQLQLSDEVKRLIQQRDGMVMELQQLQEAKPVLERAYARTPHPNLIQKIQQLEQKNRHLQFCLKQQQQYTESIMQQTWHQQRAEINELRSTVETQIVILNEQAQRLTNSDILVKDLYVENSQLTAALQRLEQQRSRSTMLLQHQGVGSVPGML